MQMSSKKGPEMNQVQILTDSHANEENNVRKASMMTSATNQSTGKWMIQGSSHGQLQTCLMDVPWKTSVLQPETLSPPCYGVYEKTFGRGQTLNMKSTLWQKTTSNLMSMRNTSNSFFESSMTKRSDSTDSWNLSDLTCCLACTPCWSMSSPNLVLSISVLSLTSVRGILLPTQWSKSQMFLICPLTLSPI